jgi:peptide/nickel transport system permease protein
LVQYILRKLMMAVPLVLGVITLIFGLMQAAPGSPADRFFTPETPPEVRELIEQKWGLDQPVHIQYLRLVKNLLVPTLHCPAADYSETITSGMAAWSTCRARGEWPVLELELGVSIAQERPVFDIIADSLPNTLILSALTLVVLISFGCLLGIFQAVRQYTVSDNVASVVSLFFYSMPGFWLALMLVLLFSLKLDLLPATGMVDAVEYDYMTTGERIWDRLLHLVLPGVALGVAHSAGIARYMRSSMLEVIRQDFVRTARAKGLPERQVVFKHALRNALLPIVTLIGLSMPFLFSGSVLIEYVFAWPGMGQQIVAAIFAKDTPVIIGCFFVYTLVVVFGNLVADLTYSLVDPRIRLS